MAECQPLHPVTDTPRCSLTTGCVCARPQSRTGDERGATRSSNDIKHATEREQRSIVFLERAIQGARCPPGIRL